MINLLLSATNGTEHVSEPCANSYKSLDIIYLRSRRNCMDFYDNGIAPLLKSILNEGQGFGKSSLHI